MRALRIGEFSAATGLPVHDLRHFDARGWLRPGEVDPDSGHRRYTPDQVTVGRRLRALRAVGTPAAEAARLAAHDSPRALRARIAMVEADLRELQRLMPGWPGAAAAAGVPGAAMAPDPPIRPLLLPGGPVLVIARRVGVRGVADAVRAARLQWPGDRSRRWTQVRFHRPDPEAASVTIDLLLPWLVGRPAPAGGRVVRLPEALALTIRLDLIDATLAEVLTAHHALSRAQGAADSGERRHLYDAEPATVWVAALSPDGAV